MIVRYSRWLSERGVSYRKHFFLEKRQPHTPVRPHRLQAPQKYNTVFTKWNLNFTPRTVKATFHDLSHVRRFYCISTSSNTPKEQSTLIDSQDTQKAAFRLSPERQLLLDRALAMVEDGKGEEALALFDDAMGVKTVPVKSGEGENAEDSVDTEEIVVDDTVPPLEVAYVKYRKGMLLYELNRFTDALKCFEEANLLADEQLPYADLYHHRGIALSWLGKCDDAIASFDKALQIDPTNVDIMIDKARVLADTERFSEAEEVLTKALKLNPSLASTKRDLGRVYALMERWEEALSMYDMAIAVMPDDLNLWLEKAHIYHETNRLEMALEMYDEALRVNPDSAIVLEHKATVLQKLERWNEALRVYSKLTLLCPKDPMVLVKKANVLNKLGQYEDALQMCDAALELGADAEATGADEFRKHLLQKLGRE